MKSFFRLRLAHFFFYCSSVMSSSTPRTLQAIANDPTHPNNDAAKSKQRDDIQQRLAVLALMLEYAVDREQAHSTGQQQQQQNE